MQDNIPNVTQAKPMDPPRVPSFADDLRPVFANHQAQLKIEFQMGLTIGFVVGILVAIIILWVGLS